jgi:hypothetical protein
MGDTYRLNEPNVACEVLEGDLILLNFQSGFYYNVRGTGADVCQFLLAGGSAGAAVTEIVSHYGLSSEKVAQDVQTFVEQLVREGLLVTGESGSVNPPMKCSAAGYEVPQCEKFDDMADQLLLDKIDDKTQDAQWAAPSNS